MVGKVIHYGGKKAKRKHLLLAVVVGAVFGLMSAKYCPWLQDKLLKRVNPPVSSDAKVTLWFPQDGNPLSS